jgi:hypothetical protein
MTAQVGDQARRAAVVAGNMQRLTEHLDDATRQLRGSSSHVEAALATVARIAEHTRILSINASIEAARAGEAGRAFAVVVDEVHRLADRTGATTREIEARVEDMHASIARVADMTGDTSGTVVAMRGSGDGLSSVSLTNREIRGIADSATHQLTSIGQLNAMGGEVKSLVDTLVQAIGRFRFEAHASAERDLIELLRELGTGELERQHVERLLALWIARHPHFELVYVTDARGRQVVDNVTMQGGRVVHDASGFRRDWSGRPWYREALDAAGVRATDIYRSSATGDFCFTIAAALRDARGAVTGVVAADVNFRQLVT